MWVERSCSTSISNFGQLQNLKLQITIPLQLASLSLRVTSACLALNQHSIVTFFFNKFVFLQLFWKQLFPTLLVKLFEFACRFIFFGKFKCLLNEHEDKNLVFEIYWNFSSYHITWGEGGWYVLGTRYCENVATANIVQDLSRCWNVT